MRLVRQSASLLFAGAVEDGGPDLGPRVVAAIDLTPDFEDAAVRGRTVAEVFPPPAADPFYSALLGVPALHRFNPPRMQHALDAPCYLNGNERVWEAKGVTVASGAGDSSAPLRLEFPKTPTTIAGLEEAGEYVAAPTPTKPYARKGFSPRQIPSDPMSLSPFEMSITRPLGRASAKGPANGASRI